MTKQTIKRISTNTNATVVQLPERNKPGVVIQGDSLRNLLMLIEEAERQLKGGNLLECDGVLSELQQIVSGYWACYTDSVPQE